MLYKKFAIEIVCEIPIVNNVIFDSINYKQESNILIKKDVSYINTIKYLDNNGVLCDKVFTYYTYNDAYNILSLYYVMNNNISSKIVEVYDNIEPPITKTRQLKIDKLNDKQF